MKQTILFATLLAILVGCGAKEEGPVFPERAVKVPTGGETQVLSGQVLFSGLVPAAKEKGICQASGKPIMDQSIRAENGKLANVLVYIKSGLEDYTFPYKKEPAVIDQLGCIFKPHVLAVQTFQPIEIRNSDNIVHNVNLGSKLANQGFVKTITPGQGPIFRQLRKPEILIPVTCDVHAYMLMYVHAIPHPFFQVTNLDGSFELQGLPQGSYTLEAVHPKLGTREKTIEIGADHKPAPIVFQFS